MYNGAKGKVLIYRCQDIPHIRERLENASVMVSKIQKRTRERAILRRHIILTYRNVELLHHIVAVVFSLSVITKPCISVRRTEREGGEWGERERERETG